MFKSVERQVWAFDCEWVPDPLAGRLVYKLGDDLPPLKVMERMWQEGGASAQKPRPYLKTNLCRLVSISAVVRQEREAGAVDLQLESWPREVDDPTQRDEAQIVGRFLTRVGKTRPQLVGYNSQSADLRILVQRAIILGLDQRAFAQRPNKPWEGVDYFARESGHNIDLKRILGDFGPTTPSLHEMAVQCGIPGKMDVDGHQVVDLWLAGNHARIVAYNEHDALTTYLLWLRMAHFGGYFDADRYADERRRVRDLVEGESRTPARAHLAGYLAEWDRLERAIAARGA